MTIKHIAMVLEAEGLDGAEKLLMIAYCNYTDAHGYCWPGQQRLAHDCGTSPATVKRVKKKLIEKKLIASQRRLDPRTGEPISNLTRVNLELLAAMKREASTYDDDLVERLTFAQDVPLPVKTKKALRGAGQGSDQVRAQDKPGPVDNSATAPDLLRVQDEPDPGLRMSPTRGQVDPDLPVKLSPGRGQDEPLTVSDPPQNHQGPVPPSVGSTRPPGTDGGTDGERGIETTRGVAFLQQLGLERPKLMITGRALRDQGLVVDELLGRGWQERVLWEVLSRPLPQKLKKDVSAIVAKRLQDLLESPLPGPRRTWDDEDGVDSGPTPTPPRYSAAAGSKSAAVRYECDGKDGLCGLPVEGEGDLCPACARVPAPAHA
ncbi:helix-turn-helix domain-containing protein [Streptomyces sp. NPDC003314]